MTLEGLAILALGFWLYVEYNYSSSFRNGLNDLVLARITTWTPIIGFSAGFVGSAAALGEWRRLRQMRLKIETLELNLKETSRMMQEKPFAPVLPLVPSPAEVGGPLAIVQPQATSLASFRVRLRTDEMPVRLRQSQDSS